MAIIEVNNLGKKYYLGERMSQRSILDSLKTTAKMPYRLARTLFTGESNRREEFWALKDVSFKVGEGEVLGIIGRNGAGKSTLLKILSRIVAPTEGEVIMNGRVGSLLEVGTGFHPELTGRENIFMNGSLLGMSHAEISKHFDEIVDFSGVEKFLDTPVKFYSSGMYTRLAFSVAAHLRTEILIVDEVLAVGDSEFQKKCLNKMDSVAKSGRTILFVSHNMNAIHNICCKGLLLEHGNILYNGIINEAIENYSSPKIRSSDINKRKFVDTNVRIIGFKTLKNDEELDCFECGDVISHKILFNLDKIHQGLSIGFYVSDNNGKRIFTCEKKLSDNDIGNGQCYQLNIPSMTLTPGIYYSSVSLHIPNKVTYDFLEDYCRFQVLEDNSPLKHYTGHDYGCVFIKDDWLKL